MWASAPTNDHGKTPDFEGGQGRPPLQPVLENRVWVEKSPRFPFRPPPKKREHPAQGRMGTTDEARAGAFRVMSCGLSA